MRLCDGTMLKNCQLTDEEREIVTNLLSVYALGHTKDDEIDRKINEVKGYYDELEEYEYKLNTSQLDYVLFKNKR